MSVEDSRVPEALTAERPWPGLAAYEEAEQAYFFGRDEETAALLRCVLNERLTLLFGQSGLGKTSLLQAGLFPKLRDENLVPVYIRIDYRPGSLEPGAQVLQRIAETIAEDGIDAPKPADTDNLWGYFHRADVEWWSARNYPLTPVLVFDQFEEVFTIGRQAGASGAQFLDELGDLIENRPPPGWDDTDARQPRLQHKILLSFREDFLPDFEALKRRIHSLFLNRIRLARLTGEAALDIVNKSGAQLLTPGLAKEIVHFVAAGKRDLPLHESRVEPALLCVFCRELNERRIAAGAAVISPDMLHGGQEAILQQLLERAFADLPDSVLECIGEHLLTDTGYRTQYPLADMVRRARVPAAVILQLEQRRILRVESRGDAEWLELTHDLLAPLVLQRRQARRLGAKYRRLVKISLTTAIPAFFVVLAMAYLTHKATENLQVAETTLLTSLDVSNPDTDSIQKKQDLGALLGDAEGIAGTDPVVAANAYGQIARIQLTPTMQAPNSAGDAFTSLAILSQRNPGNLAIGQAYEAAMLDRAAAVTAARQLAPAEADYQTAITGLQSILGGAPPGKLRRSVLLLLGHAYEGLGDDYQFDLKTASAAAAAADRACEAAAYQQASLAFQQYIKENPADPVGKAELAWAENKLGDVARDSDDQLSGLAHYGNGFALLNQLGSHLYADPVWPQHLGLIEMNLGVYKIEDEQYGAALTYFSDAETVFARLRDKLEPQNDDLASDIGWAEDFAGFADYLRAEAHNDADDREAAESLLREAERDRTNITLREPDDIQWEDDLMHTEAGLHAVTGLNALAGLDAATAITEFGQAAALTSGILREGDWEDLRLADDEDQKARAEWQLGQKDQAAADFAKAAQALPVSGGVASSLYAKSLASRIAADRAQLHGRRGS